MTNQNQRRLVLRDAFGGMRGLFTAWGALFLLLAGPAHGQQQSDASSPTQLQEITVTATKRSLDLQQAPLAITAVSGADLTAQAVTGIAQIASAVPGLSATYGGVGQTLFSMRGISTGGSDFQTQQPVGYYLDETPITLPNVYYAGQWDPGFYDMSRVEVLRGPQGTLYGAGSLAGAIRLISNQPDPSKFEAGARISAAAVDGGTPNATADGMLNVPLVPDVLAWRTVASVKGLGGYIDQTTPDGLQYTDVNSQSSVGFRTGVAWRPNSAVTLTPAFVYQHDVSQANNEVDGVGQPATTFQRVGWLEEPSNDQLSLASLNLAVDWGHLALNSNNSYFYRFWNSKPDYSDCCSGPFYPTLHPAYSVFDIRSEALTSETRLQTTGDGPFQALVGLFYQRQLNYQIQNVVLTGVTALTGGNCLGIPCLNDSLFYGTTGYDVTQSAVFGELSYTLFRKLTFTFGGRDYNINSHVVQNFNGFGSGGPQITDLRAHSNGFIPKYEISYQVDESKMAYALASEGFRIGGPNNHVPTSLCAADLAQLGLTEAPGSFGPDSVWNYELGAKTDWADHRFRLNVAGYHMKWTDIQEFTNMTCGYGFTSNIATAKSDGVEVEVKGALGSHWLAGGTLSSNNAKYTSSLSGAGIVDGDRLQRTPGTTWSANLDYMVPLSWGTGWTFKAHAEYLYTGDLQLAYPRQNPLWLNSPSWNQTNARASISKGSVDISLYANNLTNNLSPYIQNTFFRNHLSLIPAWVLPPRTIGVAIDWKL